MKIMIVGAGEVGFHIASRLARENKDVVVVDNDPETLRRVSEKLDVQVLRGSGGSPPILEEAGIKETEILLAVTDSDETNLMACLMTDILSPATKKLARVRDAGFDKYQDVFKEGSPHIDTLINPEVEVVKSIDNFLSVPGAVDVGEFADGRMKFVGIRMGENARLSGVKLSEIPKKTGNRRTLIAAVVRDEKLIIPSGSDRIMPGDLVYLITESDKFMEALKDFDKYEQPVKRVMIVGGGRIGYRLADLLEKKDVYTKIIEKNHETCTNLAEKMNKTIVLCGDGSDQNLLLEENIAEMDAVITLTNDEETNVLVSLLAKGMGARQTITRISNFSYFPVMTTIGIEQVVSPRLSAINTILQHIRRGKVLSAMSIKGEQAEIIEAVALETSDIVGRPLKNISFPKGAILAGIIRNDDIIIPSGDSVVQPDDRIIIFAKSKAVPKIEKILTVKLEFF